MPEMPVLEVLRGPVSALGAINHGAHRRPNVAQCDLLGQLLKTAKKLPQVELAFCDPLVHQWQECVPVTVVLI